jgi:NAD(P)-dependent dehydrogenase (short-subunit alcohol dehydrogenase family)
LDVIFYELDVSIQSHMGRIAHQIEQRFERLDVLVNNAAILFDTWQSAVNADLEIVNQALTTNLFGPWKLSQLCIPLMMRNNYGRIVNVSSGAGSLHYKTTDMGGRGGRPIEEGAKGIVWAATLPDHGPSGGFFFDGKPAPW